ncbi:MAG: hypothetical protein AAFZ46_06595 [Pseudomonadota bacterium]
MGNLRRMFETIGRNSCFKAAFVAAALTTPAAAADLAVFNDPTIEQQYQDYKLNRTRAMRDFQPFRETTAATSAEGKEITLTSLNPRFNKWFLIDMKRTVRVTTSDTFHIELTNPEGTILTLSGGDDPALVFDNNGAITRCQPWAGKITELDRAKSSGLPYAPICDDNAFVRNVVRGNRSSREAVAEFLRDNVVFGESIVTLIKGSFYEDAYMSSGELIDGGDAGEIAAALGKAKLSNHPVFRAYFGFQLEGADGGMQAGSWYAVKDAPGIYASAMQPGMISRDVLNKGRTHGLDGVESRADVYLVAFDMTNFELGYEVGTDHPRLDWSPRPKVSRGGMPGPDGFSSSGDIVRTGMLSPAMTERVAATFAAGFKRSHGAWRASDMAYTNQGHHYGFISNGVIFSRLHPGLSTLYVMDDGTIGMRTWTEADEELLPSIKFARQNGVPLIDRDPATGEGIPGEQVTSWLGGNWSGSAEADLRTLRGGTCMREVDGRQFLIYAYFSTATPSAMARTFQAYQCDYAMLLDMNSQDHTYMALYTEVNGTPVPEHLVSGMSAIDQQASNGQPIPRFVGFSDNRDFMYLLRK